MHFLINEFIYFWLHCVFIAACGLSPVVASGSYSLLRCTSFSLQWPLPLQSTGSRCTGFSSCGMQAQQLWLTGSRAQAQQLQHMGQLLHGMWDPPRPGLEPVSPALAGGLPTTAQPGKPHYAFLNTPIYVCLCKIKTNEHNNTMQERQQLGFFKIIRYSNYQGSHTVLYESGLQSDVNTECKLQYNYIKKMKRNEYI